jgi:aryl carrier-like protein
MTLNVLSILAMSAELERLFSSAKVSITDRRNRLGIKSIKAIKCLKSWFSKGSTIAFADNAINTRLSDTDKDVLQAIV